MTSKGAADRQSLAIILPFLVLPLTVGALWLALSPASRGGRGVLIIGSIFLVWYLLGGMLSVIEVTRGFMRRREARQLRSRVLAQDCPAQVIDSDGLVLVQNPQSLAVLGDIVGTNISHQLSLNHADPSAAWRQIELELARMGQARAGLGALGDFMVTRRAGGELQLWIGQTLTRRDPKPSTDFRGGFDDLPVALMHVGADGAVMRANTAARDLLGQDVEGQMLSAMMDGLGRNITEWVGDICAGRIQASTEVLHLRTDRPERYLQISLTHGQSDVATAVLQDVSALKTLEAQFVQSQKMQAIGQLAGGVAHDFNNLLTAISGYCDLLMLRHNSSDPDYADLDQISQNANRAAALVDQLLAFSRKQTLRPLVMDVRDTLADLTHLMNRLVGGKIVLTCEHDRELRPIRADRRQLEQVIINLVVNARDAMPNGGSITIGTDNIHLAVPLSFDRAGLPAGDYVRIQVRDEGVGMDAQVISKMFEPFYTTKRPGEGTGLGLSTAYGIVKQTGGYIFCHSTPGQGTCFSLYFPAHAYEDLEQEAGVQSALRICAPADLVTTVLLVEDEASVRAFASRALKLQDFQVIEAASAEEALDLLADPTLSVDIFVTDVVMPGMDGPTWVRQALEQRPGTKVIFMSGYAEDVFADKADTVPNSVFLAKPFSLSELTGLVCRQLEMAPLMEAAE